MKKNFDNVGVAQKVAMLLALPITERALEMQLLKEDFAVWMENNFNLKPHQMEQLNKLSAELRNQLSVAISNCLMQGNRLQFQKDAKDKEDPEYKDLMIHGIYEWQDGVTTALLTPLFIRISYRDPQQ
ncbi:MAG: hypothetical protein LBV59_02960 [Sphingobacterium sp.]|jgi:hypothetical protein|uniref:hypothetical protein n=1 Tax=Sphingobacterium sp. TaxID=341027 RepID=UPI002846510B|nr:hypothetical protein [Sphingobacterium sp.]MDR3006865.1 hypothetical protein [Sphingobacterium sp.]